MKTLTDTEIKDLTIPGIIKSPGLQLKKVISLCVEEINTNDLLFLACALEYRKTPYLKFFRFISDHFILNYKSATNFDEAADPLDMPINFSDQNQEIKPSLSYLQNSVPVSTSHNILSAVDNWDTFDDLDLISNNKIINNLRGRGNSISYQSTNSRSRSNSFLIEPVENLNVFDCFISHCNSEIKKNIEKSLGSSYITPTLPKSAEDLFRKRVKRISKYRFNLPQEFLDF